MSSIEDPQIELFFMLKLIFWTWIISRFNKAWLYKSMTIRDCQGITNWQSWINIKLLIQWCLVLWVQFPLGYFCWNFLKPLHVRKCQICDGNENLHTSFLSWVQELYVESHVICTGLSLEIGIYSETKCSFSNGPQCFWYPLNGTRFILGREN